MAEFLAVNRFHGGGQGGAPVPFPKSIRKTTMESVGRSRGGFATRAGRRRDERTKKLIRVDYRASDGAEGQEGEREEDGDGVGGGEKTTWFEKARRGAERWAPPVVGWMQRLRGVKGGSNKEREREREPRRVRREGARERRLIDSGRVSVAVLATRFLRCSARAHAHIRRCLPVCPSVFDERVSEVTQTE